MRPESPPVPLYATSPPLPQSFPRTVLQISPLTLSAALLDEIQFNRLGCDSSMLHLTAR